MSICQRAIRGTGLFGKEPHSPAVSREPPDAMDAGSTVGCGSLARHISVTSGILCTVVGHGRLSNTGVCPDVDRRVCWGRVRACCKTEARWHDGGPWTTHPVFPILSGKLSSHCYRRSHRSPMAAGLVSRTARPSAALSSCCGPVARGVCCRRNPAVAAAPLAGGGSVIGKRCESFPSERCLRVQSTA
jgi:hypothetical protein